MLVETNTFAAPAQQTSRCDISSNMLLVVGHMQAVSAGTPACRRAIVFSRLWVVMALIIAGVSGFVGFGFWGGGLCLRWGRRWVWWLVVF